jgi:uncharacterized membrane protein YfcA
MMLFLTAAIILLLALLFSMLGLGGAMLYVPLLHAFGYDFKSVAIPTGLLLNGITVLSASVVYLRAGMVDIKGAIPLAIAAAAGAPAGAYLTERVPNDTLILMFAGCMVVAGGFMLRNSARPDKERLLPLKTRMLWMTFGGIGVGMVSGLLGIGGGFLFVPMMMALGYPVKQAAATSAFVVIFPSFTGFAGHVAGGHFNVPLMAAATVAVIAGSQIGARLMKEKMKAAWIKKMFAGVLLAVSVKLFLKVLL